MRDQGPALAREVQRSPVVTAVVLGIVGWWWNYEELVIAALAISSCTASNELFGSILLA